MWHYPWLFHTMRVVMATMLEQMISPFLCPDVLKGCEEIFLENFGLDDIAFHHAQFYDAVDLLMFQKFDNVRDRFNFISDCKRLKLL